MENLDLYAKIEPMIGFYEVYENLYQIYLNTLSQYSINTILDVGCGNGNFLLHLQEKYSAKGIDLSAQMVAIALEKGVEAKQQYLHDVTDKYDVLVAIADVLNYMQKDELENFLTDVQKKLQPDGLFICDINTPHGFEDITAGSLNVDGGSQFLAIDAEYDEGILQTDITFFEQEGNYYQKSQAQILQYYHSVDDIISVSPLKLLELEDISLFSDKSDKTLLIFQNIS